MQKNEKKTEVGTFVGLGIILIGGLILTFGNVRDLFREKYRISITFPSARDLTGRSQVRLGGAKIGSIDGKPVLNETFDGVVVHLKIYDEVRVPDGSTFTIGTSGLLGDSFIKIEPPKKVSGQSIKPGAMITGGEAGGLGAITDAATNLSEQAVIVMADVRVTLEKVNAALERISTGVLSQENTDTFKVALQRFGNAMDKLDEKVMSDENLASLESALKNIDEAGRAVSEGASGLEPLLTEGRAAVAKLGPTLDKFGAAAESFKGAGDELRGVADEFRGGDGLAAAFLADPELRDELAALIANLRRHGVLFYKDTAESPNEPQKVTKKRKPKSLFRR